MNMSNRKKIILIQPRATMHDGFRAPLNLLQLASALRNDNYEIKIIDYHIDKPSNHELREHLNGALFAGISSFTGLQSAEAVRIAKQLKTINPELPLVWGGYHPSLWPQLAAKSNLVDYIVKGPGEDAVLEIARSIQSGEKSESKIITGNLANGIPSPAIDLIDFEKYIAKTLIGNRIANIHTSYGCPYSCAFCAVNKSFNHKWISKPSGQVLDEILFLTDRFGIDGIEFSDNSPFVQPLRMLEIAEQILRHDIRIKWMSMARADELLNYSDDSWQLLVNSGFSRVFVGIESGDDDILSGILKDESQNQFLEFAEKCSIHGVNPDYSITLGYPPNPQKDIERSFKLIRKLKKITPSGTVMLYRYTPYSTDDSYASHSMFPDTWDGWAEPPWDTHSLTGSKSDWLYNSHIRTIRDFQTVLSCAHHREENVYPQNGKCSWLIGLMIPIAKLRWRNGFYSTPYELRALRRLFLEMNNATRKKTIAT